jgi:mono/diheme cytochrome c family protein
MKDDEMAKVTAEGINDKAGKERMKAYKDELTPEEIKDLVAYVRKFKA